MAISHADAEAFFADYAQALVGRDPEKIAHFWGVPGLILSDGGAMPISSIGEVEAFFGSSMEQYEGIASAFARLHESEELSGGVLGVTVDWTHLDEDGEAVGGETGHYMLRREGGDIRIHVYTPKQS